MCSTDSVCVRVPKYMFIIYSQVDLAEKTDQHAHKQLLISPLTYIQQPINSLPNIHELSNNRTIVKYAVYSKNSSG